MSAIKWTKEGKSTKERFTVKEYTKALDYLAQQVGGVWSPIEPKDAVAIIVDEDGEVSFYTKEGVVEVVNDILDGTHN
jgi:hypothetical protein